MVEFKESKFYKLLQDFFINNDKETFLQFLAEFYNRTEGIIDKNNIQDDLIKELRELYLEFNEKGIDENIVREKVNYFLENSLKIKDINSKLNTNTNNIKNISSQLDSITKVIDNADTLQDEINETIINGQNIYTPKTIIIDKPLIIDLKDKQNLKIDLWVKPTNTNEIGDLVTIQNGVSCNIKVRIMQGGHENDKGVVIKNLRQCNVDVEGYGFKGTLFYPRGEDSTSDKNRFSKITLRSEGCGRCVIHEASENMSTAFGTYQYIYDNSNYGSMFKNLYDVRIEHYENVFFKLGQTSLIIDNCSSMSFGNCALGGICDTLLKINKSVVHFSNLLLVNDKKEGVDSSATKGVVITGEDISSPNNGSHITIDTLTGYHLNTILDYDSNTNININTIQPMGTNNVVISKNGISKELPNWKTSSFNNRKNTYIDDESSLIYRNSNGEKVRVNNILEKTNNFFNNNAIVEFGGVSFSGGTNNYVIHELNFTRNYSNPPVVVVSTNGNYVACVQSRTISKCNIVLYKTDNTSFNNDNIVINYIVAGT